MAGDNCPQWCSADHADEAPEHDSIFHESAPITLELPSVIAGDRFRLTLATICTEDYRSQDEGRRPPRVDICAESERTSAVHDLRTPPVRTSPR